MLDLFGSPAILRGGWAYYNELDSFAATWLRGLIAAGHITAGEVDERSIRDVQPDDLLGFRRVHFFAGIGGWDLALQLAGWPDDREVWTGSCPCQPFSSAGRSGGFDDDRHLWPEFFRLIRERRPAVVVGEQVASPAGLGWLDLVRADLEGEDYAVGAADLCAAGVRAPHIRQRLWWLGSLAHTDDARQYALLRQEQDHPLEDLRRGEDDRLERHVAAGHEGQPHELADAVHAERRQVNVDRQDECDGPDARRQETCGNAETRSEVRELADAASREFGEHRSAPRRAGHADQRIAPDELGDAERAGLEEQHRQRRDDGPQQPAAERAGAELGGLEYAANDGREQRQIEPGGRSAERGCRKDAEQLADADGRGPSQGHEAATSARQGRAAVADSFWDDVEWLTCRDGKLRPTRAAQPGVQRVVDGLLGGLAGVRPGEATEEGALNPLAHGVPNRVGLLRGIGNAIVPQVAAEFIRAYGGVR